MWPFTKKPVVTFPVGTSNEVPPGHYRTDYQCKNCRECVETFVPNGTTKAFFGVDMKCEKCGCKEMRAYA